MSPTASLSIQTLFFAGTLASLMAAGMVLALSTLRDDSRRALYLFAGAHVLSALAMLGLFLRGNAAEWLTVFLMNCAGMAQIVSLSHGSALLFGTRLTPAFTLTALAAGIAGLAAQGIDSDVTPQHLAIAATFQAGFCVLIAWTALRPSDPVGRGYRQVFGIFFTVVALLSAGRLVKSLTMGEEVSSLGLLAPTSFNIMAALLYILTPLFTGALVIGLMGARTAERLRTIADTDALTQVYSRRYLLQASEAFIEGVHAKGLRVAILMLDLDHFKRINDTYGHAAGDRVLRNAARAIADALPSGSLLARYGGEEFCALLPVERHTDALAAGEVVRAAIESRRIRLQDGNADTVTVTASIGLTVLRNGQRLERALDLADRRAYEAKARGRNCVVFEALSPPKARRAATSEQAVADPEPVADPPASSAAERIG